MSEQIACGKPTGSVVGESATKGPPDTKETINTEEVKETMIAVGKKAPDFTAPAFHKGGFTNVKLSDYLKKWVVLCFYPGDFTFV